MKKTIYTIIALLSIMMGITSCDSTADKVKYGTEEAEYPGRFEVSLYAPHLDKLSDHEDGLPYYLASDYEVDDTLNAQITSDGWMNIQTANLDNIKLSMRFLEEDNEVRQIFIGGFLSNLYYTLWDRAKEKQQQGDPAPMQRFLKFQELMRVIKDTVSIEGIKLSPIPYEYKGASLISWDKELNSMYAKFTLAKKPNYKRVSSIFHALREVTEDLQDMMQSEAYLTPDEKQALVGIQKQQSFTIADGSGWATMAYANYHISMDVHLEQATGLLDVLSRALFAPALKDSELTPRDLWIVIRYSGSYRDFHWVENE